MIKIPQTNKIFPNRESSELNEYLILLDEREKTLLTELCGDRYTREKREFKRCKTKMRTIYTRFGKVKRNFAYVKSETGDSFSPLLKQLGIPKHQHISEDFKQVLADKPSKMTYRKSAEDVLNSFNLPISGMALHKYVRELSTSVVAEQEPNSHHQVLLADGTKVRGLRMKHDARAIVSIGESSSDKLLLRHAINKSWREMVDGLDLSQYKVFVGDGEPGLAIMFCKDNMEFHYCHEHAKRDLAFFLWRDGLCKKEYEQYTSRFEQVLNCLKYSTKKHLEDKDWQRLLWRIQWAKKEISALAAVLSCRGLHESAGFLLRNKDYFTTAAKMAIVGVNVPWTTNPIERVMQEVGIRTKKKGMYWSEGGLDRILKVVLKRYFLPQERRFYKEIFATTAMEAVKP